MDITRASIFLDSVMCIGWMATYTLVLIGTVRYKYPVISPIAQAIIAPLEFACLLLILKCGNYYDYVLAAYVYWTVIEVLIFLAIIRTGYLTNPKVVPYACFIMGVTLLMIYCVTIKGYLRFFTYFNAFVGVIFWLIFVIQDKKVPMKPITLAAFCAKFLADLAAVPVYFRRIYWSTNLMCILLPIVDLMFIFVYMKRKKQMLCDGCTPVSH